MLKKDFFLRKVPISIFIFVGGALFFLGIKFEYLTTLEENGIDELFPDSAEDKEIIGTCGKAASKLGFHQKVVSYCLYGDSPKYVIGIEDNLKVTKKLYPGWFVRIYTREPALSKVLQLARSYSHLVICDVDNLPSPYNNISQSHPMIWRFSPMADPQVDVAIFRDTDSLVSQREVAAVEEWLSSNTSLHTMRDHPYHTASIMGGMWGVRLTLSKRAFLERSFKKMLRASQNNTEKGFDQDLLNLYVWSNIGFDITSHDSYNCFYFLKAKAWPTKRENNKLFVGASVFQTEVKNPVTQCPWICRPLLHKDWIYC